MVCGEKWLCDRTIKYYIDYDRYIHARASRHGLGRVSIGDERQGERSVLGPTPSVTYTFADETEGVQCNVQPTRRVYPTMYLCVMCFPFVGSAR